MYEIFQVLWVKSFNVVVKIAKINLKCHKRLVKVKVNSSALNHRNEVPIDPLHHTVDFPRV